MKQFLSSSLLILILGLALPSQADFNLINVDMGSPEGQKLSNVYGNAYGFNPQQVAPAMYGPAEEVPAILKIAQAAGTVPMTVWMMRKMGMGYGNILSTFALAPSVLAGAPSGPIPPGYGYSGGPLTDPTVIQVSRTYFLRDILQVPPQVIPNIPYGGAPFARSILRPYDAVNGFWLPPGIAKKVGLWIPPGQRKKVDWVKGPVVYEQPGHYHGKNHKKWKHKKFKQKKWKHKKAKGKPYKANR